MHISVKNLIFLILFESFSAAVLHGAGNEPNSKVVAGSGDHIQRIDEKAMRKVAGGLVEGAD